ncbi:MAG: RNA-guided endonuclease TnpB family protein, partial [Candidatus Heimdallarchaeaceae archaeon]
MQVKKTIKCKIIGLTNIKKDILNKEYNNLQDFLQLKDVLWWDKDLGNNLHSANKQQGERYYKIIKRYNEYPISLRNDLTRIEQKETKISKYWLKIPVKLRRKLWVAIRPFKDINFTKFKICESKLYKIKDDFFVNITIQKEVNIKTSYSSILSIDLGEKVIATSVVLVDQKPQFYGREVRGIRRKYAYIRKKLGNKKLLKEIKKLKNKEQRVVNNILHNISKQIVKQAEETDSIIVLGDLKGIRKNSKGKRFNRIVSNMPYFKLTQMITYKANWKGIKVVKINERGTS